VSCTLHPDGKVSIQNVAAHRYRKDAVVNVDGHGPVSGDVAWGGNWFFLVNAKDLEFHLDSIDALLSFSSAIRQALTHEKVTGPLGEEVDHIELFGTPSNPLFDSRNFVLCPGNAYDRSPCGTGTSAKLACLAADGKLDEGAIWRQESIVGSVFEGSYRRVDGGIVPTITGQAYICGEGTLLIDPSDPFCWGIS
jgi:4-hydroxyproline epimerase